MRQALKDIEIFAPNVNGDGSFNKYGYTDANGMQQYSFPITDNCERSAQLMGDDYVRLRFNLTAYVPMAAFSFIRYDGQTFFLMNDYCPQSKGSVLNTDTNEVMSDAYEYDVKFYSVANMLRKPICYRHVKVPKENSQSEYYEWDEPEISVSATLETMYVLIVGSIAQYVSRLQAAEAATANYLFPRMLQTLVNNGLGSPISWLPAAGVKLTAGTELSTFSFNGDNIADVCTAVANQFSDEKKETEWYIVEDANHSLTLHFCKCEDDSDVTIATDFSQKNRNSDKHLRPIITGGLSKVEYSRDTSNIPQVIVPYGAERNMTYAAVKGIDEISHMQSTFGKRVRLKPETDYDVWRYAADGVTKIYTQITTDIHGGILNDQVTTGVEKVEFFEDVYPQCHFQITKVDERIKRQDGSNVPEYTCEGDVVSESGVPFVESDFFPIQIEEGTTLSVRFESGFLNGREFEIANKSSKKNAQTGEMDTHYTLRFTIVADGSIEDGTLIPSGNFKPMVGDKFALFNMKMPEAYITYAQGELAQKAYEKLLEYQETVPDVKCTTNPRDFAGKAVAFGKKYKINSEKIGFTTREVEIDGETRMVRVPVDFLSRITAYSYKLTKPDDIQFTLSSALVRGVLSEMASAITSVTNAAGGLGQRSLNLSRRGWRDASEIADMLDSIRSEMMLIGNEKYQFGFTMSIEPHDASHRTNEEQGSGAFNHLHIGYGTIQHTQQPYVDSPNYPNAGLWEVSGGQEISTDANGDALVAETPYFVYADCQNHAVGATATIGLYADKQAGDDYMLLGILSSEYEHQRVFSRTNGFTAIAGGTITTEQIQDANRQLIIDFQSNPPRIIAKRGAQIIGNITFISSDGAETNLATKMNNVDEELAKEIGGENLYSGVDPLQIITTTKDTDIVLENGKKYVISVAAIDGDAWGLLAKEKIGSAYSDLGWIVENGTIGTMQHYEKKTLVVTGHGGKLALQVTSSGSDYYYTLTGIMVQQGEKPTTYHAGYLAKALERDATKEVTSIDGGLLLSALIKLAQGGVVRAGMSGLADYGQKTIDGQTYQSEGVGFWAGSDYVDALNAACGIETNTLPPVFLSKTGYKSRIGCFRVIDKDEVRVETGENKIIVTNDTIDNKAVIESEQSGYFGTTLFVSGGEYIRSSGEAFIGNTLNLHIQGGKYRLSIPALTVDVLAKAISWYDEKGEGVYVNAAVGLFSVCIAIENNGKRVYTSRYVTFEEVEAATDVGGGDVSKNAQSDIIAGITQDFVLEKGTVKIGIYGEYSLSSMNDGYSSDNSTASAEAQGSVTITNIDRYEVLAKDGLGLIASSNVAFYIRNKTAFLEVIAKGLPSSNPNVAGQLYTQNVNINGTTQKIVCVSTGSV